MSSNKNKVEQGKIFLESIKVIVDEKINKINFNKKRKGIVQSLNNDKTANVTINGDLFENVKIRAGLSPYVGEVVWVEIPNNSFREMYIDKAKNNSDIEIPELEKTSWDNSFDCNIEINHNLNDYPLPLIIGINTSNHSESSMFSIDSKYQVNCKCEYIDENNIRLYLSEDYSGVPIVTQIDTHKYTITFSEEDEPLTLILK